eukprot:7452271-Pyramimonas_sp.AAC.1
MQARPAAADAAAASSSSLPGPPGRVAGLGWEPPQKSRRLGGARGGAVDAALASPWAQGDVPPSAVRGHELFIAPGVVMICLLCGGISTGKNTSLRDRCPPPPY